MQTIRNITRHELLSLSDRASRASVYLFEVLSEQHWASGHIPGAKPMPLDRIADVATAHAPDKDADVVVYCASATCKNSHLAAEKLAAMGYRSVSVYAGGKADWKDAGLELEVTR